MNPGTRRGFVVGAGLAGLSAALELADRGIDVTVLEASPHLGGRCRSYEDAALGLLDNGTHALMRANPAALTLLERLGTRRRWHSAPDGLLRIVDLGEGSVMALRPTLAGFRRLGLGPAHFLRLLGRDRPVAGLFDAADRGYRCVIEPLTVAALNTPPEEASSRLLRRIFREAWRGPGALMPLVAERGLGPDLVEPLAQELERLGGRIETGARVRGLEHDGGVSALDLGGRSLAVVDTDAVILAVPPAEAERLTGMAFGLAASPIVNAHFALNRTLATAPRMIGVLGAAAQWVLLRGEIASITVSAADTLVDRPAADIAERLWRETRAVLDLVGLAPPEAARAYRIVKERRATIRQGPGLRRPGPATAWRNLFLAGDWTDTGLPATIESALRSGRRAARAALGRRRAAVPVKRSA